MKPEPEKECGHVEAQHPSLLALTRLAHRSIDGLSSRPPNVRERRTGNQFRVCHRGRLPALRVAVANGPLRTFGARQHATPRFSEAILHASLRNLRSSPALRRGFQSFPAIDPIGAKGPMLAASPPPTHCSPAWKAGADTATILTNPDVLT